MVPPGRACQNHTATRRLRCATATPIRATPPPERQVAGFSGEKYGSGGVFPVRAGRRGGRGVSASPSRLLGRVSSVVKRRLRCRGVQGGRMQLQPINKTWAAVEKLFHPLVAASQLHPVDVAQPEHNQYTLCGHLRTSRAGSHCHCAQRCCAGAALVHRSSVGSPLQRRRPCSVTGAQSATDHSAHGTRLVP